MSLFVYVFGYSHYKIGDEHTHGKYLPILLQTTKNATAIGTVIVLEAQ